MGIGVSEYHFNPSLSIDYNKRSVESMICNFPRALQKHHPCGEPISKRKIIVYLPNISAIERLSRVLSDHEQTQNLSVFQIHTKNQNRDQDLDKFKSSNPPCIALACGQLRVGYSDHKVDTVYYLQKGAETIDLQQVAGRVMRYDATNPNKRGLMITFEDVNTRCIESVEPQHRSNLIRNNTSSSSITTTSSSSTRLTPMFNLQRTYSEREEQDELISLGSKKRKTNKP